MGNSGRSDLEGVFEGQELVMIRLGLGSGLGSKLGLGSQLGLGFGMMVSVSVCV